MKFSTYLLFLCVLVGSSCRTQYFQKSHSEVSYSVRDSVKADSITLISQYLQPFKDSLSKTMNATICEALENFEKKKPNGSLCNLVVDAMYLKAKTIDYECDGAITNFGGIRLPEIAKGKVSLGKIYELLPFDNELVIISLKGSDLEKWLNLIGESGGWPVQFGHSLIYRNKQILMTAYEDESEASSPFTTIKQKVIYKIEPDKIYKIATNDYVANGGDQCTFLVDKVRISAGISIRDLMIETLETHAIISPTIPFEGLYKDENPSFHSNRIIFLK